MPIPIELVRALATPTGATFMVRAQLQHAVFRPIARLLMRQGRFVAEITFQEPIGAERMDGLVVMLSVKPDDAPAARALQEAC